MILPRIYAEWIKIKAYVLLIILIAGVVNGSLKMPNEQEITVDACERERER
jgi:hypothetical protein